MEPVLAHFTVADAPGTAAIFLLGVATGLALIIAGLRAFVAPLLALAIFATLGAIADAEAWSDDLTLAIDLTALAAGVVIVGLLGRTSLRRRAITDGA